MVSVDVHCPVAGAYSSAVARGSPMLANPPATRTSPEGKSVAVWSRRGVLIAAVVTHGFPPRAMRPGCVLASNAHHPPTSWPVLSTRDGLAGVGAACANPTLCAPLIKRPSCTTRSVYTPAGKVTCMHDGHFLVRG